MVLTETGITMFIDQTDLEYYINGKKDARDGKQYDKNMLGGYGDSNAYRKGYVNEKKRMESKDHCRLYGIPFSVTAYSRGFGGACVKGA